MCKNNGQVNQDLYQIWRWVPFASRLLICILRLTIHGMALCVVCWIVRCSAHLLWSHGRKERSLPKFLVVVANILCVITTESSCKIACQPPLFSFPPFLYSAISPNDCPFTIPSAPFFPPLFLSYTMSTILSTCHCPLFHHLLCHLYHFVHPAIFYVPSVHAIISMPSPSYPISPPFHSNIPLSIFLPSSHPILSSHHLLTPQRHSSSYHCIMLFISTVIHSLHPQHSLLLLPYPYHLIHHLFLSQEIFKRSKDRVLHSTDNFINY